MTNASQTWGTRSKRTSVVALGLVAILAGVAVAYFLTTQKYAGNKALGGTLTVDADLPLDFTDEPLYPTSKPPAPGTVEQIENTIEPPPSDFGYADKDFTVDNNNPVKASYQLYATCEECVADPADTPEQAAARDDKRQQFESLYVHITGGSANYQGRLADLTPDSPMSLGTLEPESSQTYNVKLWLQNDPANVQPQGVENIWEFFISAKTPV